jgi:hypothetical protein
VIAVLRKSEIRCCVKKKFLLARWLLYIIYYMKKEPNPKKLHHYVPKFYLNHFGTKNDHNEKKIYIQQISTGQVFSNITKKTAAENDYHTVDGDPYFEDVLMRYENEWAPIHNNIIENKSLNDLTDIERKKYSQFMGFLVVRTASYRAWAIRFAKIVLSAMGDMPSQQKKEKNIELFSSISAILPEVILRIKSNIDNNPKFSSFSIDYLDILNNLLKEMAPIRETGIVSGRYRVDLNEDYDQIVNEIKKMHVFKMEEIGEIVAKTIYGMVWVLNENITDELFITSDNPVCALPLIEILHNQCENIEEALKWVCNVKGKSDWYLSDGKPNTAMTIIFPLTPKLILLGGYGPDPCAGESNKRVADAGLIDVYNSIIVLQANEYLYSKSEEFNNYKHVEFSKHISGIINDITNSVMNNR